MSVVVTAGGRAVHDEDCPRLELLWDVPDWHAVVLPPGEMPPAGAVVCGTCRPVLPPG